MDRERYTSFATRSNGPDGKQISEDNPSNYERTGVQKDEEREKEKKRGKTFVKTLIIFILR